MKDVSSQNFGYLIAFVLPGFVALHALGMLNPSLAAWLQVQAAPGEQPTVGGFLYITLASLAAGITASTLRWLVIDTAHHWSGIARPSWDDSKLQDRLGAFEALVTAHYRYYQFYGNSVIALTALLSLHVNQSGQFDLSVDTPVALLIGLFWLGSRDSLSRYYSRATVLLGDASPEVLHDERPQSIQVQRPPRLDGRSHETRAGGAHRRGQRHTRKRFPTERGRRGYAARAGKCGTRGSNAKLTSRDR